MSQEPPDVDDPFEDARLGHTPMADERNSPALPRPTNDDYRRELSFIRRRLESLARGRFVDELEFLTTDAWLRFDRSRAVARNREALMNRIAWVVWVDYYRARKSRSAREVPFEEGDPPPLPETPVSFDPTDLATLRFTTLEFFRAASAPCLVLAEHFFSGRNWFEVARVLGEERNAVAKRWERCMRRLIPFMREDPGLAPLVGRLLEGMA